jgi:hypothetical protein
MTTRSVTALLAAATLATATAAADHCAGALPRLRDRRRRIPNRASRLCVLSRLWGTAARVELLLVPRAGLRRLRQHDRLARASNGLLLLAVWLSSVALIGVVDDPSVIARFEQGQKLEWFATLRARLGVAVTPDAIAYVTGGAAVGEVMTAGTVFGFDADGDPINTIVSSHNTKAGWTVGGGIEGRIADNWTGKIEYLYLDLGAVTTIPATPPGATTAVAFSSRVTDNLLRVGVNYKFDAIDIWAY